MTIECAWRSSHDLGSERAAESKLRFAKHVIASRGERRWRLQVRLPNGIWDPRFWVEVLVLDGGKLMVHGDVETVVFGRYTDSRSVEATLRWIGRCTDIGYYVAQKAAIGTGEVVYERNADVACYELATKLHAALLYAYLEFRPESDAEWLDESSTDDLSSADRGRQLLAVIREIAWTLRVLGWIDEESDEDEESRVLRDAHRSVRGKASAIEEIEYGNDIASVAERLGQDEDDHESYYDLGQTLGWRVYVAHAAVARLCDLLDAEREQPAESP